MLRNFGANPPEVNAAKLLGGRRGTESMYEASYAWNEFARGLFHAGYEMGGALMALDKAWNGQAATRMARAANEYRDWLYSVAEHAEYLYKKAELFAIAYNCAKRNMVSPQRISENRALVTQLANDNMLGVYTIKIQSLETQYQSYWYNNADAMMQYAREVDSPMKPFPPPARQIINENKLRMLAEKGVIDVDD
ncbi:PPE family protein [Mycobacterium haemophilum]|uniref:PPE family protein n=1 Tax=Mycobacterium haemophilum TaxID=29311 RepID=UPI0009EAE550|nr:PPE family protein [Mycobacterium haemophilum]MCV7339779.1 PPE family protein [Mycobacterium haemophilum DSM 44634]